MRVLVTGGAGFIGSALARRLISLGHSVVLIDNLSTGHRANVPAEAGLVEADVADPRALEQIADPRFDVVCHLAAQSSGPRSADVPYLDFQTNAASTLLLTQWCLMHHVPRFVYASSMAAYGNPPAASVAETAPCDPVSYYGVSKLTSERLLGLASSRGLQVTSLRMFSVYGPGQDLGNLHQGMVSIFLAYLLRGVEVPVIGSLERFRDFVYIDDVIDCWMAVLSRDATPAPAYNVGTGRPTTVRELLAALTRALGLPPRHPIRELAGSPSDQFGLCADVTRVAADIGWTSTVSLDEGLRRMVGWARGVRP
jgi:UDP-glucose 4-epimerase